MPEHQRDTVIEFFEDMQILTSFLGYRLFEQRQISSKNILYCKNSTGTDAQGVYAGKVFRVLASSKLRKTMVPSFDGRSRANRERLLSENATEQDNDFILDKDIIFPSPSAASSFCLGTSSNGWDDWKEKDGRTLHELLREKE